MAKKTLIIDCDGVLYPCSVFPLGEFVSAMKKTYREDLDVDGQTQARVSAETIQENKLGMFNYIKAMCEETGYNFDKFFHKMQEKLDYTPIRRDDTLFNALVAQAKQNNVVILTNNHMSHLDKVLQYRFGKNIYDLQKNGIKCFDIKSTEKNGVFYPKQDPEGLVMFTDRLGVLPQDCILVDDTQRNLVAAEKIGMKTVLITEDYTLKQYLTEVNARKIKTNTYYGKENG